jgi:DnaK suppressor protein
MSADAPNFPPDEYLSESEISELHGILQQQLLDLLDAGRQAVHDASQIREVEADELDIAITESNRDFALRMADRERRLLKKIRHALEMITQGDYGTCESCGASITYKRLLARPVARLCIDCKTEAEQLEGRHRFF